MKKLYLFGCLCFVLVFAHTSTLRSQTKPIKIGEVDYLTSKLAQTWQVINNSSPSKTDISFGVSSNSLTFSINSYKLDEVQVNSKTTIVPKIENATYILKEGAPNLPKFAESLIIPAEDEMKIEVISSSFYEIKNVDIAPSKGNLTRDIDPNKVPYVYGKEYKEDKFFPGNLAELSDPYIIRDVRGQTVLTYPVQYNPIQKVLRIYTEINVKVASTSKKSSSNLLTSFVKDHSSEFDEIYKDHFINYNSNVSKNYTPLNDSPGKMLIICYDSFIDEMADFVAWKTQKGIPVEIVGVSTIGSSASQIKTYVSNYYNTNGLTYLLLVGDDAQVPASSTSAGPSDNNYGYIIGSDHYADIFVGRFSAETESQVSTMVDRTIHYERDIATSETWMENAIGSASSEGNSSTGDDGESDAEHMNNVESDLVNFGYSVTRVYESGGSVTQMSNAINAGTGLINYCGHGSDYSWVNVPFGTTQVNALTNVNKLPFIMDVACVNGNFTDITCFAETWLRATSNSNPTGAIGIYGSTINQSWAPPMRAQDEFTDILVESYTNNIKRTFAGAAMNSIFDMIDHYGADGSNMADTWTLFGDPSFVMRTKQPTSLSVTHATSIEQTASTFAVNCTTDNAFVSLTINGEIIGTKTVSNGTANIGVSNLPANGTVKVTVTAYNKTVYTGNVIISGGVVVAPVADFNGSPTTVYTGNAVKFSDLSTNYPTSWSWSFPGGSPSTSTAQNPSVTYSTNGTYEVSLTVSNSAGTDTETKTGYITVEEAPISYCSSGGSDFSDEWISEVQIGNFSNSSSGASYTDFTNMNIELTSGESTNIELTPAFSSSSYTEYWVIWIDYNNDGDFEDSGEAVYSGSGKSAVSGSFTVSDISTTTRMRISMKYNGAPTPCETFSYGEVEDYTVTISEGTVSIPVADFSAAPTTITEGQAVQFTDISTNEPTSWSWSFPGGSPSTSTVQNPSVTYNTAGTYEVSLTVSNSAGTNTESKTGYITVEEASIEYCSTGGSDFSYEWISEVQIGSFSNSSSGASYTDFTNMNIELTSGESTNIVLTPGFGSGSYTEYWVIWIDYNNDGDFEDSGEAVYSGSGKSAVSGSFTVSDISTTTRMRISMKYNGTPSPCETYSYGEVEDYTVSLTRSKPGNNRSITNINDELSETKFKVYPNPVKDNLHITTDLLNAEIKIINSVGAVVESRAANSDENVIDVSALIPGLYSIHINSNGKVLIDNFIKQ